jgi:hypothetical protein
MMQGYVTKENKSQTSKPAAPAPEQKPAGKIIRKGG